MNRLDHFYFEVGGFGDRQTLELMEDGEIVVKLGQAKIPWFYEGAIQLNPNSKNGLHSWLKLRIFVFGNGRHLTINWICAMDLNGSCK